MCYYIFGFSRSGQNLRTIIKFMHSQMYQLAKFQLHILKAFEVTAIQSSSNKKIISLSQYRLQMLTKTDIL